MWREYPIKAVAFGNFTQNGSRGIEDATNVTMEQNTGFGICDLAYGD